MGTLWSSVYFHLQRALRSLQKKLYSKVYHQMPLSNTESLVGMCSQTDSEWDTNGFLNLI